jgi:hypothetical protein
MLVGMGEVSSFFDMVEDKNYQQKQLMLRIERLQYAVLRYLAEQGEYVDPLVRQFFAADWLDPQSYLEEGDSNNPPLTAGCRHRH